MYKIIAVLVLSLSFLVGATAQTSFGFRTGMNFNQFVGDLEPGETYSSKTGFHIGLGVSKNFTDIWGVRGELVYSQKGGQVDFDGDSFFTFDRGDRKITHQGVRSTRLTVRNSHLDLPIVGFGRLANWIEVSVGIVPSFLVAARGVVDLNFSSPAVTSDLGTGQPYDLSISSEYSYFSDEAGGVSSVSEPREVRELATANTLTYPSDPGAYYFQETKDGSAYNIFGLDAMAGVSIFVNNGLFLGLRVQYGLLDVTNNKNDFSKSEEGILRTDKDVNLTYQGSVGFYF